MEACEYRLSVDEHSTAARHTWNSQRCNICNNSYPGHRIVGVLYNLYNANTKRNNIKNGVPEVSSGIAPNNRIVSAIGKHIRPENTLPCCRERICIEESSDLGDIVAGLEVVHAQFTVEDVAAVHDGVDGQQGTAVGIARCIDVVRSTPSIIVIADLEITLTVGNTCYIALTVDDIVESVSVEGQRCRDAIDVDEVNSNTIANHPHQLEANADILITGAPNPRLILPEGNIPSGNLTFKIPIIN